MLEGWGGGGGAFLAHTCSACGLFEPWLSGCRVLSGRCRGLSGRCRAVGCRVVSRGVGSRQAETGHVHLSGLSGAVGCCRAVGLSGCRVSGIYTYYADPNTLSMTNIGWLGLVVACSSRRGHTRSRRGRMRSRRGRVEVASRSR